MCPYKHFTVWALADSLVNSDWLLCRVSLRGTKLEWWIFSWTVYSNSSIWKKDNFHPHCDDVQQGGLCQVSDNWTGLSHKGLSHTLLRTLRPNWLLCFAPRCPQLLTSVGRWKSWCHNPGCKPLEHSFFIWILHLLNPQNMFSLFRA